jgi:hypothetical protein
MLDDISTIRLKRSSSALETEVRRSPSGRQRIPGRDVLRARNRFAERIHFVRWIPPEESTGKHFCMRHPVSTICTEDTSVDDVAER